MSIDAWGAMLVIITLVGGTICWAVLVERAQRKRDRPYVQEPRPETAEHLSHEDKVWLAGQLNLAGQSEPVWLAKDLADAERRLVEKAQRDRLAEENRKLAEHQRRLKAWSDEEQRRRGYCTCEGCEDYTEIYSMAGKIRTLYRRPCRHGDRNQRQAQALRQAGLPEDLIEH